MSRWVRQGLPALDSRDSHGRAIKLLDLEQADRWVRERGVSCAPGVGRPVVPEWLIELLGQPAVRDAILAAVTSPSAIAAIREALDAEAAPRR